MSYGRLDPDTPIPGSVGRQTLGDFWAWGYSNILTNNLRGVFAEFLVGTALGVVRDSQWVEWDEFDLLYNYKGKNKGIEIKSSTLGPPLTAVKRPRACGYGYDHQVR